MMPITYVAVALSALALVAPAVQAAPPATGMAIFKGMMDGHGCTPFKLQSFDARGTLVQPASADRGVLGWLADRLQNIHTVKTSDVWSAQPQSLTSAAEVRVCKEQRSGRTEALVMSSKDENLQALLLSENAFNDKTSEHYPLINRTVAAAHSVFGYLSALKRSAATLDEAARIDQVSRSMPRPAPARPGTAAAGAARNLFETFVIPATNTLVFRSPIVSFVISEYGKEMKLWTINEMRTHSYGVRVLGVFSGVHLFDADGVALDAGAVPLQQVFVRDGNLSPLEAVSRANSEHELKMLEAELSIMTLANPGEASFATNHILSVLMLEKMLV